MDFSSYGPELIALGQVLFIDIVLAGDNAIVVGMAAAGLPPEQRRVAILWGIGAATLMRIAFASITVQLLSIVGIVFAGGVLLLWVCWKMYRELRDGGGHSDAEIPEGVELDENGRPVRVPPVLPETDEEKRRYEGGRQRREERLARRRPRRRG